MSIEVTQKTDTQATIKITLDEAALKPYVDSTYNHLRQKVRAKGFRPGKAPNNIVDRELGSAAVQSEVMEEAVEHSYVAAIRDENLPVVDSPQISLQKFVPYTELQYEAKVELLPEIKLGNYQSIRVARPKVKVDPAEIDKTIEDLRRREATRIEVQDAAKLGDEVVLDFEGTQNGEPVRGAKSEGHTLQLGSGQFIPGFEEEVVGLKPGEDKSFDITFPEQYQEESLRGAKVRFAIKVHKVTQLHLPELNDDFAATVGPFKSVDELKTDVADRIASGQAESAARDYENQVLSELLKGATYKLPDALVRQQLERMKAELNQNLAYSGLDMDKYLQMINKDMSGLEEDMRPEAERRVALALVLTEVAKAEQIKVEPDELDAEIARLKLEYADPATQAELDKPGAREDLYNHLMASRVITKLISYAESK